MDFPYLYQIINGLQIGVEAYCVDKSRTLKFKIKIVN